MCEQIHGKKNHFSWLLFGPSLTVAILRICDGDHYTETELTSQEYFKPVDIRQRRKGENSIESGYVGGGLTASGSCEQKENAKVHAIKGAMM